MPAPLAESTWNDRQALRALAGGLMADFHAGSMVTFEALGFHQVHRLAARLHLCGDLGLALDLYEFARAVAARGHDSYGVTYFSVCGARVCLDMLDFRGTELLIARLLGLDSDLTDRVDDAMAAIMALDPPRTSPEQRAVLQGEAMYLLGALLAAQGRLVAASDAARRAGDCLAEHSSLALSVDELELHELELMLDRGELSALTERLRAYPLAEQPRLMRLKLQILWAQLHTLQGRWTAALEAIRPALVGPYPLEASTSVVAAHQLCFHVLARLNRLDDARDVLGDLEALGVEVSLLRALLAARRDSAGGAVTLPLAAAEVLGSAAFDDDREPACHDGAGEDAPRRRSTRAVSDYGRLYNQVLLLIHRRELTHALALCAELAAWAEACESPLMRARQTYLWALLHDAQDAHEVAQHEARTAAGMFARLGMVADQWAAADLLVSSLTRTGAPASERADAATVALELHLRLVGPLPAGDRVMYMLNKWSAVETKIASLCEQPPSPETLHQILALRRGPAMPQERAEYAVTPAHLPPDTALVQYLVLPDRVRIFVVQRSGCSLVRPALPTTRAALWELQHEAFRLMHQAASDRFEANREPYVELAHRLGIPQIAALLSPQVKRLVIAGDDTIGTVQFAALPLDGGPLVRRFALVHVPELVWSTRATTRALQVRRALGVFVSRSIVPGATELARLDAEEGSITAVTPWTWEIKREGDASVDAICAALPEAELAHFACHGVFDVEQPGSSGLVLYEQLLTTQSIRRLDLTGIRLVVMTACWGGDALTLPGGVRSGMAQAFLDAGAAAVIGPRWKIENAAARKFGARLYSRLARVDPVDALAETQRACATTEPMCDWGGYVASTRGCSPGLRGRAVLGMGRCWRALVGQRAPPPE